LAERIQTGGAMRQFGKNTYLDSAEQCFRCPESHTGLQNIFGGGVVMHDGSIGKGRYIISLSEIVDLLAFYQFYQMGYGSLY
jgi:hypothetical protein